MKRRERIITIIMLLVISLSNVAVPVSDAAQLEVSSFPKTATKSASQTTPAAQPKFHQPDNGSVLGDSTSLLVVGSGTDTQNSASKRVPIRMQQLPKKVYQTNDDITLAVTNPDNDPFTTSIRNAKGQAIDVPVSETNDGTTTDVQLTGSNEITPGKYTIEITDDQGNVLTQDFSWGVLAMNFDKDTYSPGETGNISFGVLDDQGNMVCDANLQLRVTSSALGIDDTLSTNATGSAAITTNPQCQKHDFSLQPDYQASYTFTKAGSYTMQLTAATQTGTHAITQTVPVTNNTPFDIQRISATRIYPPNTYPMTINIKANRDFSGTVTETVPQDFTITPATQSAQFTSGTVPTSYDDMQTMYLNSQDPAIQLQNEIATQSAGLVMPFHGNYPITQGFGAQMTDPTLQAFYTQYGLAGHDGVDFGVPMDTPLYAVDNGTVIWSGPGDYGVTIIIQHSWGQSYYGHLSTTAVKVGDNVTKGELIGYSGESGEATGPHLHFGIRPNNYDMQNGYYGKVDPLPYLPYNQTPQPIASLGPTVPLASPSPVLGASTSAAPISLPPSLTPTITPTTSPTPQATVSATPEISQAPSATPSGTQSQSTTTITESTTPPANTAISVLDKQILINEQLANSTQTEKVKVISWQVSLKKGQTTSLGYDFKAPPQSPQFYLLGPMQFYQSGSNKVIFQEQRAWQIASDDVGVEWYSNTANSSWNGYSWQYRKKIDIDHTKVSTTGIGGHGATTYDATGTGFIASWNHTVSGSNPALLVGVAVGTSSDSGVSASATYNGTAMTLLSTVHTGGSTVGFLDVFGLLNPTTGTHTVTVTVTGGFAIVEGGSESFDNVTSFGTAVSNSGTGTTASVTTSGSTLGNIVAGFVANGNNITSATTPSTSRFIANYNNANGAGNAGGATSPSTGSNVTMSWTVSTDIWGAVAVEVMGSSVTYDATGPSTSGFTPSGTSLSWNHTVSGSKTALLVGVAVGAGNDTGMSATATYNGVSMSLLSTVHTDNTNAGFLDVFGLISVPTGTHTVAVTVSGGTATELTGGSESFDNANSFATAVSNFGSSGASTVTTSGSTSGNIVAGFAACGSPIPTVSSPATNQFTSTLDTATGAGNSAGATSPSTGSNVTISWPSCSDIWGTVGVEVQAAPSASPTVDFMDSGGDATESWTNGESSFWSNTGGTTPSVDCTVSETGPCSLKFTDSSGGAYIWKTGVLADTGRRISSYFKFDTLPSSTHDIYYLSINGTTSDVIDLNITSGGVLQVANASHTQIGSNGATLSTGTWYRISFAYQITSTTSYSFTVYVNGVPSITYSQTSGGTALTQTGTSDLYVGLSTPFGTSDSIVEHMDDIYVDSGSDLSDPGNIHVTAKRPFTNGNQNQFPNHTGTGSGYGSGHAIYVNDMPVSTSNSVNSGATDNLFENYTLESASQGQVDISSYYPVADEAWVYAKASGACTTADKAMIINNGSNATITLTTSDAFYTTSIQNSSSYPSGSEAVGISSCATGSTARTVTLEDTGMMIAYTTTDPNYLSNFPVLVNLPSDTDLHNHAQSSGNDILFTDSTGETLLPFEIEGYTSSTGSLQAWVNISSLSADNDTIIYMYFGNPSASSQANASGTWNSNYDAVWHMQQNPAGSAPQMTDSTSNANNGTTQGSMTSGESVAAQISNGLSFNGTSQYVDIPYKSIFQLNGNFTISFWSRFTGTETQTFPSIISQGSPSGGANNWLLYVFAGSGNRALNFKRDGYDQAITVANAFSLTTLNHFTVVYNSSAQTVTGYVNGVQSGQITGISLATNSSTNDIWFANGDSPANIILDEVEISSVALSPGWIQTEYTNENSPSSFETLGSVETDIYAPLLSQMLRHGQFFGSVGNESGVLQPFTW